MKLPTKKLSFFSLFSEFCSLLSAHGCLCLLSNAVEKIQTQWHLVLLDTVIVIAKPFELIKTIATGLFFFLLLLFLFFFFLLVLCVCQLYELLLLQQYLHIYEKKMYFSSTDRINQKIRNKKRQNKLYRHCKYEFEQQHNNNKKLLRE